MRLMPSLVRLVRLLATDPLEQLRRAKQGAKNFQPKTHISQDTQPQQDVQPQSGQVVKPETRRITITVDEDTFYAFKAWCVAKDKQSSERVNMTTVANQLIQSVLAGRIDPFEV